LKRVNRDHRKIRGALAFIAAVLLLAVGPTQAPAANDRFLYVMAQCCSVGDISGLHNGPFTTADTATGAHQVSTGILPPIHPYFALSPDGQLIAYSSSKYTSGGEWLETVISIARSDGSGSHEVKGNLSLVSFDPTGTKLVVSKASETSPCPGVCLMSLDGSTLTTLTTQTTWGSISPDGTKLVWAAPGTTSKTKGVNQIFVAKTDGTAPQQLTNFTSKTVPPGVYSLPKFGPGNQIAFWGEPLATNELWTMKSDGTGIAKVPIGPGNLWFSWTPEGKLNVTKGTGAGCGMYTVNPNGTEYQRVPVSPEGPSCQKYAGIEGTAVPKGTYRQPSTKVGYSDFLAAQFEPVLRFDSSEQWRPLNVESFFGEGQHRICESGSCDNTPITSAADLNRHRGEGAYVDIAGHYNISGDETSYYSPYSACTSSGLRDCDVGARSAIYWRSAGAFGGYPFIDYWFFYRANYFSEEVDFHEGDWEGVTIAPSLSQGTFDYAAFSQHGTFYSYLRDVLRCEDYPATNTGEPGSCGIETYHGGFRVDTFPANGSHANYTTPCSEEIIMVSCQQNGSGQVERGYDGAVRWGRAFDDPATAGSSLLKMPNIGEEKWTDWPGDWGSPPPEFSTQGGGPASPADQNIAVECASLNNGEGCVPGPRGAARVSSTGSEALGARSPGLTAVSCSSWLGQGISAAVCNPSALRRAVLSGTVGDGSEVKFSLPGSKGPGKSASGRGIAQLAGNGLRSESEIEIDGKLGANAIVWTRVNRGIHQSPLFGKFKLRMPSSQIHQKLRLRLKLRRSGSGSPRLWLGHYMAESILSRRPAR
jgi:hypothetical protein